MIIFHKKMDNITKLSVSLLSLPVKTGIYEKKAWI